MKFYLFLKKNFQQHPMPMHPHQIMMQQQQQQQHQMMLQQVQKV